MARIVAIIMLLIALAQNPYGYYILLRWVICAICFYYAFVAYKEKNIPWALTFGVGAAIYNPIFPLHLGRQVWSVVNIISVIVIVTSLFALRRRRYDLFDPNLSPHAWTVKGVALDNRGRYD